MKKINENPELKLRQHARRWKWRLFSVNGEPLAAAMRTFATKNGAANNFEQTRIAMETCTVFE